MDTEPSFSRLVFGKAISESVRFLGYKTRDIALAAVTLILGFGIAYIFVGKAETVKEIVTFVAFTLAPAGIVLFIVFGWNLFLAPAALAYEASRQALQVASTPKHQPAPKLEKRGASVNWKPWKLHKQYSLIEFSKMLDSQDPGINMQSTASASFLAVLIQDAKIGVLKFVNQPQDMYGRKYVPNWDTTVDRDVAIAWAKSKGIDVSHIE